MKHTLPNLPYPMDALSPHMSAETLQFHHGKHHKAYVDKLNELIPGTEFENMSLEDIIKKAPAGPIFNNAAQVWNHTFFWNSLTPKGGEAKGELLSAIERDFGALEKFKEKFTAAAVGQFGSGWAWLVKENDGKLAIVTTSNADTPFKTGKHVLLTCDVWEHAYYIDYRNERKRFVETMFKIMNWDFASKNYSSH